jgi:hypothetical protein
MNRNEKVKYFMHDARGCSNPKNLDYETMGGDSKLEARKYIIYLEKENNKLKRRNLELNRLVAFVNCHIKKWINVREMQPSIQVLKRGLPKVNNEILSTRGDGNELDTEKSTEAEKLNQKAEGVFDAICTIPTANYFGSNFISLTALNNFGVSLKQKAEKL